MAENDEEEWAGRSMKAEKKQPLLNSRMRLANVGASLKKSNLRMSLLKEFNKFTADEKPALKEEIEKVSRMNFSEMRTTTFGFHALN